MFRYYLIKSKLYKHSLGGTGGTFTFVFKNEILRLVSSVEATLALKIGVALNYL